MIEIKFRGIDKKRNEFVYGYYYKFGDRAFIIEPGKPGIPEQHIEVVPDTVGHSVDSVIEEALKKQREEIRGEEIVTMKLFIDKKGEDYPIGKYLDMLLVLYKKAIDNLD